MASNAPLRTPRNAANSVTITSSPQAKAEQLDLIEEKPKVSVVSDTPSQATVRVGDDVATEQPQSTTDKELDSLRAQIVAKNAESATERQGRLAAERQLEESRRQQQDGQAQTIEANRTAAENGIKAATSELANAKAAYAAALGSADTNAAAEANDAMILARQRLGGFEYQKQQIDAYVAQQARAPRQNSTGVVQQQSQALTSINGVNYDLSPYSAKERAWITANPEFLTDNKFRLRATAAAQLALAEGIEDRESDAYIQFIDGRAKQQTGQVQTSNGQEATVTEQPPASQRTVSAAAPVSRTPASRTTNGRGPNGELTLSKTPMEGTDLSEVEAAEWSFPDLPKHEAYAKYAALREEAIARGDIQRR